MTDVLTCHKCGKTQAEPELHVLPDGWERSMGDDYCDECMSVVKDALACLERRKT
jgi:hypothetical protein